MNDMKQLDRESFFRHLNEDEKKLVMERMHKESIVGDSALANGAKVGVSGESACEEEPR